MATILAKDVLKFIMEESRGRFFSIRFIKRTDGTVREMLCRYGVQSHKRGGESAYDFKEHKLVCVFDVHKNGYRSIPIEGMLDITINGVIYEVQRDEPASSDPTQSTEVQVPASATQVETPGV